MTEREARERLKAIRKGAGKNQRDVTRHVGGSGGNTWARRREVLEDDGHGNYAPLSIDDARLWADYCGYRMVLDFVPAAEASYLDVVAELEHAAPRARQVLTRLLAVANELDDAALFMLEKAAERAEGPTSIAAVRR